MVPLRSRPAGSLVGAATSTATTAPQSTAAAASTPTSTTHATGIVQATLNTVPATTNLSNGSPNQQSPHLGPKKWSFDVFTFLATVLAIVGLAWTLYTGAVGLKVQTWTVRNDAFQTCLSLLEIGQLSAECNRTIEAGFFRPPVVKRALVATLYLSASSWTLSQSFVAACTIAATTAAGICSYIYLRPRVRPDPSVISLVRCTALISRYSKALLVAHGYHFDIDTNSDEAYTGGQLIAINWQFSDSGQRIGVFYDSDHDSGLEGESQSVRRRPRRNTRPKAVVLTTNSPSFEEALGSTDRATLRKHRDFLVDWFRDSQMGGNDPGFRSARILRRLQSLPLQSFKSLSTNTFDWILEHHFATSSGTDCELYYTIRARAARPEFYRLVWALLRELPRRLAMGIKTPALSISDQTNQNHVTKPTSWLHWDVVIDMLKSLRRRFLDASCQRGIAALSSEHRELWQDVDIIVDFSELTDMTTSETSLYNVADLCNMMLGCRARWPRLELLHRESPNIVLTTRNLEDMLPCAWALKQQADDALHSYLSGLETADAAQLPGVVARSVGTFDLGFAGVRHRLQILVPFEALIQRWHGSISRLQLTTGRLPDGHPWREQDNIWNYLASAFDGGVYGEHYEATANSPLRSRNRLWDIRFAFRLLPNYLGRTDLARLWDPLYPSDALKSLDDSEYLSCFIDIACRLEQYVTEALEEVGGPALPRQIASPVNYHWKQKADSIKNMEFTDEDSTPAKTQSFTNRLKRQFHRRSPSNGGPPPGVSGSHDLTAASGVDVQEALDRANHSNSNIAIPD